MELKDVIQHPYLRTDSYGKIFLYCTRTTAHAYRATPSRCPSPSAPMYFSKRSRLRCCVFRT